MKNIEVLRRVSPEELARFLVYSTEVDVRDIWDDSTSPWYMTFYHSPTGGRYDNEEEAIKDTIHWLI